MHAFLLKTEERTIEKVPFPGDDNLQWYYDNLKCDVFTSAYPPGMAGRDVIFVDDEGLFKPVYQFFGVKGFPQPLAGRGIVLGSDREGNAVSPETSQEWLHANVYWIERLTDKIWGICPALSPRKVVAKSLDEIEKMLA